MNSGQSLLVIGAFAILSLLTHSVNSTIVTTTSTGLEMEADLAALSMAESMMDEILDKSFDQATTNGQRVFETQKNLLTRTASLGTESGEAITTNGGIDTSSVDTFLSKTKFNDADDYSAYHRKAWDPRLGWFEIDVTVRYLDEDALTVVTDQTFAKEITACVTNFTMSKNSNGIVVPLVLKDIFVYRKYF